MFSIINSSKLVIFLNLSKLNYQFRFFYASTKKHLILLYLSNKYIDIRLIDDPSVRVWYYIQSKVDKISIYKLAVSKDGQFIAKAINLYMV